MVLPVICAPLSATEARGSSSLHAACDAVRLGYILL